MPWVQRESQRDTYDYVLLRASTPSKSILPRGHRRPTLRWCWYSGVKSWAELLIWAYSPPMGLYRTAIVQGLSSAHGRGERRPFKQFFGYVCRVTLEDTPSERVSPPAHIRAVARRCFSSEGWGVRACNLSLNIQTSHTRKFVLSRRLSRASYYSLWLSRSISSMCSR